MVIFYQYLLLSLSLLVGARVSNKQITYIEQPNQVSYQHYTDTTHYIDMDGIIVKEYKYNKDKRRLQVVNDKVKQSLCELNVINGWSRFCKECNRDSVIAYTNRTNHLLYCGNIKINPHYESYLIFKTEKEPSFNAIQSLYLLNIRQNQLLSVVELTVFMNPDIMYYCYYSNGVFRQENHFYSSLSYGLEEWDTRRYCEASEHPVVYYTYFRLDDNGQVVLLPDYCKY